MQTGYPQNGQQQVRGVAILDQSVAGELAKSLKDNLVKDEMFVEADVELSTSQKAFLLKCLEREWTPMDCIVKSSLKVKLEA